jgi:predicted metal-dependent peptidase
MARVSRLNDLFADLCVAHHHSAMKSPGYKAARHEWRLVLARFIGRSHVDRRFISGRFTGCNVYADHHPAMKSPGYKVARHEWRLISARFIGRCHVDRRFISGRSGRFSGRIGRIGRISGQA